MSKSHKESNSNRKTKKDRIEFVKTNISRDWSKVIFSDLKKFNLRGPTLILNTGETPTMRKKCCIEMNSTAGVLWFI